MTDLDRVARTLASRGRADVNAAGAAHLIRRATWGPTPDLVAEVNRKGAAAWLEEQLSPSSIADAECDRFLQRFGKITRGVGQVRAQDKNASYGTMQELGYATIGRYVWSRRQLFEVVCDFWSNHLNVACPSTPVWADRHDYDATVIRRHAFGRFSDMLVASGRHPSMLHYLNGGYSEKTAPNENYGRELMELHTVGVDGGYSETDVKAAARVFTGWVFQQDGSAGFAPRRHEGGAARVMAWSTGAHDPAAGPDVQASLLRHLAALPATARNIARKLCLRFVSDQPPASLVDRLASVYLDNDTAVVPVLRALFASEEFAASAGAKTRRPLEGLVAAVRALGPRPGTTGYGGADTLFIMARGLGHAPLSWLPPNGYPDVAAAWVSAGATMRRWNTTWEIASRRKPADLVWPAQDPLFATPYPTWLAFVQGLVERLLFRPATTAECTALLTFCGKSPVEIFTLSDPWLSPTRLPDLVAMVLDAPGHMER